MFSYLVVFLTSVVIVCVVYVHNKFPSLYFTHPAFFFLDILVPSAPPQNVRITPYSSWVLIRWSRVPMEHRNGEITGYDIELYDVVKNIKIYGSHVPENNKYGLYFTVPGLKKYYNYSVRIAAETSSGRGNYSSWIEFKTNQSGKKKTHFSATVVVFIVFINYYGAGVGGVSRDLKMRERWVKGQRPSNKIIRHTKQSK